MKRLLLAVVIMVMSSSVSSEGGSWLKDMENPGKPYLYIEGDIEKDRRIEGEGIRKRSSLITARWPGGIVPYNISAAFTDKGKKAIMRAIADFDKYTCVKFIPWTRQTHGAHFVLSIGGCSSPLGYNRWRKVNNIRLSARCLASHGSVLHEMSHTIGIHHEQTRGDRAEYIKVHEENIKPRYLANFPKLTDRKYWSSFNTPYDYYSIMHYGATAFSKNGKITIETLDKTKQNVIGQRHGFSPVDVDQINIMYKCTGTYATVAPYATKAPPAPPTTAKPPPTICVDDGEMHCLHWLASGYCRLYPMVRETYCCKTCKSAVARRGKKVNKEGSKWRFDTRCGSKYKLENGGTAQCNPKAANPCCSSHGWCGNRPEQCDCASCKDYRVVVV